MPFVPPGFVERLVSRLHDIADVQHYWQNGAVLEVRIGEGSGVFRFTNVTQWMCDEGTSDVLAAEYAKALNAVGVECAEELTLLVDSRHELPAMLTRTDAARVQNALTRTGAARVQNAHGDSDDEKKVDKRDSGDTDMVAQCRRPQRHTRPGVQG